MVETTPARELLAQKQAGNGPHPLYPIEHMAFSILTDGGNRPEPSLAAIGRLRQEFVDWNEIRVARQQEIVRALGTVENAERVALRIKEEYNTFFDSRGTLGFDFLAQGRPAEMRRALVQILPRLSRGAVSLLLYEFCPGASLPLSDEGLKRARKDGIASRTGDRGQLGRILAEELEPAEIGLLLQYWELESSGSPYGEPLRGEGRADGKKSGKTKGKSKAAKKNK